jgi:GntR family transcriptional regulator of vanillate catabolism
VVVTLREKLLGGQFRPGERLVELTLVPLLNASRTPVRLALERLAHQGLLEPLPYGGFRVREFTIAEIWDAIEIRGVLEGTAARFAAERLSGPEDLDPLRRADQAFPREGRMDLENFVQYLENNRRYHRQLWTLAKSPMLERALESACALPFAEPGALVFGGFEGAHEYHARNALIAVEHHRLIIEAIENREGTRAESLAREHARMSRANLDWALRHHELSKLPGASLIRT